MGVGSLDWVRGDANVEYVDLGFAAWLGGESMARGWEHGSDRERCKCSIC